MSVRTDQVNLIVNVKGDAARNQMNELRKKAADIKFEMQGLKKGTAEYIAKAKELKQVTEEYEKIKKQIGLTALTQKELEAELRKLKAQKGSIAPFTKEFKEWGDQIKKVENRLYEVKNGVQGFKAFFSKIKDEVKQFGVMAAGYLGLQFLTSSFSNMARGAGKTSDQLADLRRVSGLTKDEVGKLNSELSGMDTRTSVAGLREIAIIAGRLGVAKEDLAGFTQATDKLVVSLGAELGSADQITDQLGKILSVFDGNINADNITRLGNSIVEMANSGAASGGFITDFTQRLSGLAKSSNLSLGATIGLGGGLEELGSKVESSSTAIQKVITTIASDLPKAARIAGVPLKEFTDLFAKTPEEAIIKFAEGLSKNKQSFSEIANAFKDAGEEGARVVSTLALVGQKGDYLRERINLAKTSLQETSAINEAFALKNETFGATLDKLSKNFTALAQSAGIQAVVKGAVNAIAGLVSALKAIPLPVTIAGMTALVSILLLYTAAKLKAWWATVQETAAEQRKIIVQKISNTITAIQIALQGTWITLTQLLTGKINLATAAQRIWNLTVKQFPLFFIIGAAIALKSILEGLFKSTKELTSAQRVANEVSQKALEIYGEQVARVETLKKILTSEITTLQQKKDAYAELIKIHPEFAKTLQLDVNGHLQGVAAIDQYIKSLKEKATAQARLNVLGEKTNALVQLQVEFDKIISKANIDEPIDFNDVIADPDKFKEKGAAYLTTAVGIQDAFRLLTLVNQGIKEKKDQDQILGIIGKGSTSTSPAGGNVLDNPILTVGDRKDKLKKQLADLVTAYDQINETDKKAREKNLKQQKELENQITALEGNKTPEQKKAEKAENTAAKHAASEYAQLKAEASKFYKELQELKKKAAIKDEAPEQKEIDAVTIKYQELYTRARDYFLKKAIDEKKYAEESKLIEEALLDEIAAIRKKFNDKEFEKRSEDEYDKTLLDKTELAEEQKRVAAQSYADGKISKKEYEAEITRIENEELANRIMAAIDYSANVKKAADDVTKFKKDQEKKQTADAVEASENRVKNSKEEALAKLQLEVLKTKPADGQVASKANIKAQKDLLQLQFDQEMEMLGLHLDKKNEIYLLKEAELNEKKKEIDNDGLKNRIDNVLKYIQFFKDTLDAVNQFFNNRENKQLAREKSDNDKKKQGYKDQLDKKLISKDQYDKKVQKLDDEQDRREREIKRKQAKREKALNLFQAILNTARGVTEAIPNIALMAIAGIIGGIQIASIANAPLPELGKGDWMRDGDKHSDPSGGIPVKIERDEAVMSAAAMTDKNKYTVTGTVAQITSALNSRNGGLNWQGGAVVQMAEWLNARPSTINPGLAKVLQMGGYGGNTPQQPVNNDNTSNELLQQLLAAQKENTDEIKTMKRELHAVVSVKEFQEKESQYEMAKQASNG